MSAGIENFGGFSDKCGAGSVLGTPCWIPETPLSQRLKAL